MDNKFIDDLSEHVEDIEVDRLLRCNPNNKQDLRKLIYTAEIAKKIDKTVLDEEPHLAQPVKQSVLNRIYKKLREYINNGKSN